MALFQAFRAVRPAEGKAEKVAALPYDVVSRKEAREIGEKNPYSFLHVDRAEMDLDPEINLYDAEVYQKAKENLDRFQAEGTLIQDEKPNYYLYELIRKGKSQTGIVGVSSIDDYMNGVIKKHELTREDKEQDRIHHVDICDANTGPIFLACRYPEELLVLMENWKTAVNRYMILLRKMKLHIGYGSWMKRKRFRKSIAFLVKFLPSILQTDITEQRLP